MTLCAEGGQLQLNAFEPTIGYCVLSSLRMLTAAIDTLTKRCIEGIERTGSAAAPLVQGSIGLVTALAPTLGTRRARGGAARAQGEPPGGRPRAGGRLADERAQLDQLLELEAMTHRAEEVGRRAILMSELRDNRSAWITRASTPSPAMNHGVS